MFIDDSIPKHRKKKKKKKPRKSDHKHIYEEEVLIDNQEGRFYFARRCIYCQKIGEVRYFEVKKEKNSYLTMLSQSEILEKYKHLTIVKIDEI